MNKVLVENTKINTRSNAKFVMDLLENPKHSCKIHWLGQISKMHHHLVFFSMFNLRLKINQGPYWVNVPTFAPNPT